MEILETVEKIHKTSQHGKIEHNIALSMNIKHDKFNHRVALLISILACILALLEVGRNTFQNSYMSANIEASDLWSFFQSKTIRMLINQSTADELDFLIPSNLPPEKNTEVQNIIAKMRTEANLYASEPETGEGRKELAVRAKKAEQRRSHALSAYHMFEYGAVALQIAIVLASSAVLMEVSYLVMISIGLGGIGSIFGLLGWLTPTLIHF